MIIFRQVMSYLRLAMLMGVLIGCSEAVIAGSQELNVDQQSTAVPAMEPRNPTARVADPLQKSALPLAATQPAPADGPTLQALAQSINPLWVIPVASLSAVQDRPIFSPSRRPPISATIPPAQPFSLASQDLRPPFALIGVVAGETDGIGIFLNEATKGIVRLKTGESDLGWTLNLVKRREATLQRGGEIAVLEIPNP